MNNHRIKTVREKKLSKNGVRNLPEDKKRELSEDRKRWLKDYPKEYDPENDERQEGQVFVSDIYDQEAIEIDKLVYLALHHRAIPIFIRRDIAAENYNKIIYLTEDSEQFLSKCQKEGITTFDEYDKKHKIHYRSKEWFMKFRKLLSGDSVDNDSLEDDWGYYEKHYENDDQHHNKANNQEYNDILKEIDKIILEFS